MWVKKITVATGITFAEELDEAFVRQITNEFSVYVTPFTTNMHLLRKAKKICKCCDDQESLLERFRIVVNGEFFTLDGKGKLIKLIRYLKNPQVLYLDYVIGLPGGLGLDMRNGIHYFLHTKELRHVPHVHAKYQGEEISIDILTLKVKNSFKNKKKQKEAVDHVRNKKEEYLEQYNMKTNGIHVYTEYVENGVATTILGR